MPTSNPPRTSNVVLETPVLENGELENVVDEVAARFADLFTEDELREAREFALDAFAAHPVARLLGERLQAAPVGDVSGERSTERDSSEHTTADREASGTKP